MNSDSVVPAKTDVGNSEAYSADGDCEQDDEPDFLPNLLAHIQSGTGDINYQEQEASEHHQEAEQHYDHSEEQESHIPIIQPYPLPIAV
jgi:hypothetical protein